MIAEGVQLPVEATTETWAYLATRGAGKTYSAGVFVEELLEAHQQVVIIDPMSAWWGLRSSADGKRPGYPIVILGGDHGDLPLQEGAGELVADLVVNERLSAILDLSDFTKNARRRFVTDFAERLYHKNRDAMHLVLEEADMFAPQNARGDERMLGSIEELVRRGRQRGIGTTLITQRSSVINKNVLELTENLVILRNLGPRSREAIKGWIETHGTEEERKVVMDSLQSLPTGSAWLFSPYFLKTLKQIQFRKKHTFDSSATPRPGERRRAPKTLAEIDLEAIGQRMAATIEQAKSEDPKELRREIAQLKRELQQRSAETREVPVEVVREVPVFSEEAWEFLQGLQADVMEFAESMKSLVKMVEPLTPSQRPAPQPVQRSQPAPTVPRPVQVPVDREGGTLSKSERAVLSVLAQYPQGRTMSQLAILSGYRVSGGFRNTLSALRTRGAIEGANSSVMTITDLGLQELGTWDPLPTGPALVEYWKGNLSKGEAAILQALVDAYPHGLTMEELAERTGYQVSGGFRNMLSKLRTIELLQGRNSEAMRAASILMEA